MRRAALRGTVWGLTGQALQAAVAFAGYVWLARHVDSHALGLATLVLVVTGFLAAGSDLGMGVLLVQRREADDRRAALWALMAGGALTLLVALLAPWIALLYGRPEGLVPLLRAGACALLVAGGSAVARARLQRALQFRTLATLDVAVESMRALLRVGLAIRGLGAWSIVLGDLIALALGGVFAWLLAPAAQPGRDRRLVADGLRLVGARTADACFVQADRFAVGSRFGAGTLGLYGFAYQHTMVVWQRFTAVVEQVALPLFSLLQGERERLRRAYLTLTRLNALAVCPAAILLWAIAPALVAWLYPERWEPAVPALRALCLAVAAAGLNSHPGLVWIACGRMRLRLAWSIANLGALAGVLLVGLHFGATGVAHALAARSLLATLVAQAITRRVAGVRHRDYARAVAPGALLAAALLALLA